MHGYKRMEAVGENAARRRRHADQLSAVLRQLTGFTAVSQSMCMASELSCAAYQRVEDVTLPAAEGEGRR